MVYLLLQVQCGIFLGTAFYNELAMSFLPIGLIILAVILLIFVQNEELPYIEERQKVTDSNKLFKIHDILSITLLIGISIVVRSIGGSAIQYTWKTGFVLGILYTVLVILGKLFGGFIGDRLGLKKTAIWALALACICLILGFNIPFFGFFGIFLFNIPMSITLLILEKCNTKYLATMVGSNTLFLFIGYLICLIPNTLNNYAVLITSIIFAIISIYYAFKIYERKENN